MSADTVARILRADLRRFAGYRSARSEGLDGTIWLNANESPWPAPEHTAGQSPHNP
jgi:histidinol-phosphate aminotransferase